MVSILVVSILGMVSGPDVLWAQSKTPNADGNSVQTIRVRFLAQRSEFSDTIFATFQRQVQDRCEAVVKLYGSGQLNIEFALSGDIGKEGFRIEDGNNGVIRIVGNDERGLLYGVGKFLRTSRYDQGGFTPSRWRGTSMPNCQLRGIYFATHLGNWYMTAPEETIRHYVEDMALWGYNTWVFNLPVEDFNDFNEKIAREKIDRLRRLMAVAKKAGFKVGIGQAINNGLKSAPKKVLASDVGKLPGSYGVCICPSLPQGHEYLLDVWGKIMDTFADIDGGIDYIWSAAYDWGGCGCEKCAPWGYSGFLKITKDVMTQVKTKNPNCKLVVSTWFFSEDEFKGLTKVLASDNSWIDYLMGGRCSAEYPAYMVKNGIPGNLPMTNFPEISMWGMRPWGGYGANPQPGRIQGFWKEEAGIISGGVPYSEGLYEDLNKAIYSQLYWKKDNSTEDIVREYIAFEYSPDVVDEVTKAIRILETSLTDLSESSCKAYDIIKEADAKLTVRARYSWRWRILYLRAMIDCQRFKNGGKIEGPVLKQAFDELNELYLTNSTTYFMLRPPKVP
jgi:hypothetical protein